MCKCQCQKYKLWFVRSFIPVGTTSSASIVVVPPSVVPAWTTCTLDLSATAVVAPVATWRIRPRLWTHFDVENSKLNTLGMLQHYELVAEVRVLWQVGLGGGLLEVTRTDTRRPLNLAQAADFDVVKRSLWKSETSIRLRKGQWLYGIYYNYIHLLNIVNIWYSIGIIWKNDL